jgi:hypothetical protein
MQAIDRVGGTGGRANKRGGPRPRASSHSLHDRRLLPSATSLPGSRTKLHLRPTLVLGHRFVDCVFREAERGDHGTRLCSTSTCMSQPCPRTPAFAQ